VLLFQQFQKPNPVEVSNSLANSSFRSENWIVFRCQQHVTSSRKPDLGPPETKNYDQFIQRILQFYKSFEPDKQKAICSVRYEQSLLNAKSRQRGASSLNFNRRTWGNEPPLDCEPTTTTAWLSRQWRSKVPISRQRYFSSFKSRFKRIIEIKFYGWVTEVPRSERSQTWLTSGKN
jgi:hypothetical protein